VVAVIPALANSRAARGTLALVAGVEAWLASSSANVCLHHCPCSECITVIAIVPTDGRQARCLHVQRTLSAGEEGWVLAWWLLLPVSWLKVGLLEGHLPWLQGSGAFCYSTHVGASNS
jgi:hypothetical protein